MGGHPYWYFVPYEEDIQAALDALRDREFRAGRYNPVTPFPKFPSDPNAPCPGAQHRSIDEALEAGDADGTRSILDLVRIGTQQDFCIAAAVPGPALLRYFGTDKPSRAMIEANEELFENIERGQGIYVVVFEGAEPREIFFAGCSFD